MTKIITVAIGGKPIEPSIRVADDKAADTYLRNRFGTEVGFPKMKGAVWFNGTGAARMLFDPAAEPSVKKALPKLEDGMVIWVDSAESFAVMQKSVNCPAYQVVDA